MVKSAFDRTWESVRLGDHANVLRGGSPRPIQDYLTNSSQGINWIKIGDTRKGDKFITSTVEKIIPEGLSKSREVFKGDLLLSNSMSFGRPYILEINGCIHDGWLVIQDYNNSFETQYLYYSLLTNSVKQQFNNSAAGSGVHNLNKDIVSNVMLNKPKKDEQIAIAAVLSDIDSLMINLEKLITKKKNIKQGAMQELLTGKRRLLGFEGKWRKAPLGEFISFKVGYPFSSEYFNNSSRGLRIIKNGDLKNNDNIVYTTENYKDEYCVYNEDVLVGMDGDFIPCRWKNGTALLNQRVGKIISDNAIHLFFYYALFKPLYELQKGIGATTVKHLSHNSIVELIIPIPPTEKEQIAIASVLSDMDSEIDELEKKLVKYRNIKKGMMSELLTGHIRLIKKEGA